jgi:hypothetical protein
MRIHAARPCCFRGFRNHTGQALNPLGLARSACAQRWHFGRTHYAALSHGMGVPATTRVVTFTRLNTFTVAIHRIKPDSSFSL